MNLTQVLDEGNRVKAQSAGAVDGATIHFLCPLSNYDITRTESGWVTRAINDVPLSEYAYASPECAPMLLDDTGSSLLQLHPIAGSVYERDLYLQRPDGDVFEIGPMLPPSAVPPAPTGGGIQAGAGGSVSFVAADATLSHILFVLEATNQRLPLGVSSLLWPDDTTVLGPSQIIESLYEYTGVGNSKPSLVGVDNTGRLISDCGTSPGGYSGLEGDHLNLMSVDGARVFFTSIGRGLPARSVCASGAVVPTVSELFARVNGGQPQSPVDGQGMCTVLTDACTVAISEPRAFSPSAPDVGCTTAECQADINQPSNFRESNFEKASADGSKVYFSSPQQLLDEAKQDPDPEDGALDQGKPVSSPEKGCEDIKGANGCNLYEYDSDIDSVTGKPVGLMLVSKADAPDAQPLVQGVAAVSEDGSHVYFVAKGELTNEPNDEGVTASKGEDNLYVRNTLNDTTAFIGILAPSDVREWVNDNGSGRPMNVTDDGRFLVFTSGNHLTKDDVSVVPQVFMYDSTTGALTRISKGDEGRLGVGAPTIQTNPSNATAAVQGDAHPAVSENGAQVVFRTSEALTANGLDNVCENEVEGRCDGYRQNVYEYTEGHLNLIGYASAESSVEIDSSGRDIFFATTESLTPQDSDTLIDLYDARVDGGFPVSSGSTECGSDGCPVSFSGGPEFVVPSSVNFTGPGNLPAPTPVPSVKVKVKVTPLPVAQRLAKALKACRRRKHGRQRTACEAHAKRRYRSKKGKVK